MYSFKIFLGALSKHPGTPIAAFLTIAGFFMGLIASDGDQLVRGGMTGSAIMSIYWIPVLITTYIKTRK